MDLGVNLVLFLTRVVGQSNADAANNVSKWTGTVYLFSLVGAFLSDSYWGRYKTCAIFQAIFVVGLALLSLSSYLFLLKPRGCGDGQTPCDSNSTLHVAFFYISLYMVALGNVGYQPNIATFGANQFDAEDPKERSSKISFFSYFYLALNLGSLFSNTILGYFEFDTVCCPGVMMRFLGKGAVGDQTECGDQMKHLYEPWGLMQRHPSGRSEMHIETPIMYSVVFTQMASLFVEQGAAMKANIRNLAIPPASMSSFDILSVASFIFIYPHVLNPVATRVRGKGLTELERMGIGLVISILAMIAAGTYGGDL